MSHWTVPQMWLGQTVAVLASGPSMSWQIAQRVRHLPRIVVNTTYRLAQDADVIYAADSAWWMRNPEAFAQRAIRVTIEPMPGVAPPLMPGLFYLRNTGREGFDPNPSCLRTHNNSGMQAVQVAMHAGAARILLLGFDMHGGHWHEPHPTGETSDKQRKKWVSKARALAGLADIVNCTPGSALDCFRFQSLDDALTERLAA